MKHPDFDYWREQYDHSFTDQDIEDILDAVDADMNTQQLQQDVSDWEEEVRLLTLALERAKEGLTLARERLNSTKPNPDFQQLFYEPEALL